MGEPDEEALHRLTIIRVMGLAFAGPGRCPDCQQRAEVFARRRGTSGQALPESCLACWKARR